MSKTDSTERIFKERIGEVQYLVDRTNKSSVLVIQQFPIETDTVTLLPKIRESVTNVIAFVELGDVAVLSKVMQQANEVFDYVVFDADIKTPVSSALLKEIKVLCTRPKLFFYSDNNTWADAGVQLVLQKEGSLEGKNILITGKGLLLTALVDRLKVFGGNLHHLQGDDIKSLNGSKAGSGSFDFVIGATVKGNSFTEEQLNQVIPGGTLYDIGIGNFTGSTVAKALAEGREVYRIDVRAGLSSLVLMILETNYLIDKVMGRTTIRGVELVAGGVMGKDGAVIVDDINHPANVIGVADGMGNVKIEVASADNENLTFVERLIQKVY